MKATAESMLSVQPDLVLVPNWMSPDAIGGNAEYANTSVCV